MSQTLTLIDPEACSEACFDAGTECPSCDPGLTVPAKYDVCETCGGKGTHVNRAIDGNGLTAEDFDQDPDFREDYMRGVYDVACEECRGVRVVLVPDEEKMDAATKARLEAYYVAQSASRRERESEERWGY